MKLRSPPEHPPPAQRKKGRLFLPIRKELWRSLRKAGRNVVTRSSFSSFCVHRSLSLPLRVPFKLLAKGIFKFRCYCPFLSLFRVLFSCKCTCLPSKLIKLFSSKASQADSETGPRFSPGYAHGAWRLCQVFTLFTLFSIVLISLTRFF